MHFIAIQTGVIPPLPHHSGRVLSRPLIRQILREIKLSPAEFIQMLLRI